MRDPLHQRTGRDTAAPQGEQPLEHEDAREHRAEADRKHQRAAGPNDAQRFFDGISGICSPAAAAAASAAGAAPSAMAMLVATRPSESVTTPAKAGAAFATSTLLSTTLCGWLGQSPFGRCPRRFATGASLALCPRHPVFRVYFVERHTLISFVPPVRRCRLASRPHQQNGPGATSRPHTAKSRSVRSVLRSSRELPTSDRDVPGHCRLATTRRPARRAAYVRRRSVGTRDAQLV